MNYGGSVETAQQGGTHSTVARLGASLLALVILAGPMPASGGADSSIREFTNELGSGAQFLPPAKKAKKVIKNVKRALRLKKDFYYFTGKRIALARSLEELAIQFRLNADSCG